MKLNTVEKLKDLNQQLSAQLNNNQKIITVCGGSGCQGSKANEVIAAFKENIEKLGLVSKVVLKETGCHGFCEQGPLVVIRPEDIFYKQVSAENVPDILEKTIKNNEIMDSLLYQIPGTDTKVIKENEIPFYNRQERIIMGNNGFIDAKSIEDYISHGGYLALAKVLAEMQPEQVITEIEKSELRGRGGGGYPTGRKWRSCRNAPGDRRYVICNADEGDPGAYMDRGLLEGNPHAIIEGMIIGAYAIGSQEGYVYVRAEYPLAVENCGHAINKARELGLLGENILGSGFSFDIKISKGGGAFVCGESTALMLSIEGKVGEPRLKHIHTVESGLHDKPTNLNNVETWANIPLIINKGADWYRSIGTQKSKGTKLFSLVGKVVNTGLVEVPMGVSLRKIIFDIGGGIPGGKKFKAVQTGGPSGGCIPESLLDLPVVYDELTKVGSMMGSGGMIVMDEDNCMVEVARYFLTFLVEESCGKCTTCREGTYQLLKIVTRITEGKGTEKDLTDLEEICETVMDSSLCALGKTAPNPVMSTLRCFRDEYEAHIRDKKCPAGQCKALIKFTVVEDACTKCGVCFKKCPSKAIRWEKKQLAEIISENCTKCGICFEVCKFKAIAKA
jgi:NADH:ubiquinone oxidoreductase, NADH-binding (51 kD) subunit